MRYQTFDKSDPGSSDSSGKLAALRLDRSVFRNARVLDLGCNEGYFCGKALEYGARRVVGIDQNPELIESAKSRFPMGGFLCQSWDHGWPPGEWDIILMLSAFHYVKDPDALFGRIRNTLSADGVFALECGLVPMCSSGWQRSTRADGSTVRFTSSEHLASLLGRNGLTCRYRGASVSQAGDDVPRSVFHCGRRHRSLVLVTGPSLDGKTSLCRDLRASFFSVDDFVHRSSRLEKSDWTKLPCGPNLTDFYSRVEPQDGFFDSLYDSLPNDPVVVVDIIESLSGPFSEYVRSRSSDRVWEAKRHV